MTEEEIRIASNAMRNDVRYTEPISKDIFRNAISTDSLRWPNGEIIYDIDYELHEYVGLIHEALADMMLSIGTRSDGSQCISFKPRIFERNYIHYFNSSEG
jgi:hypothetical protein